MPDAHVVRLSVPARPGFVRFVRLSASAMAADLDMGVDDIEDLRVAVNELFALLVGPTAGPDDSVDLTFSTDGQKVMVEGSRPASADAPVPEMDPLAVEILRVVADEHEFSAEGGRLVFRMVKGVRAPT